MVWLALALIGGIGFLYAWNVRQEVRELEDYLYGLERAHAAALALLIYERAQENASRSTAPIAHEIELLCETLEGQRFGRLSPQLTDHARQQRAFAGFTRSSDLALSLLRSEGYHPRSLKW